ncbi:MAG: HRDC domain-containing protein, partial [Miltoncostaeaceae bacterium]
SGRDRAVLAAVAAWREREARRADRPTSWVMPDRTLVELAKRKPSGRRALENERGMPDRLRGAELDALMEAIASGTRAEPITMPAAPPPELQIRAEILSPLASALVSARAEAAELAPSLLATRDDISRYLVACMTGAMDGEPLAAGWRHELAGRALADMVAGRIALAAIPERPYLAEIPRDPSAGGG